MARMNKKWIAICSAAVGSIYATGLTLTLPDHTQDGTASASGVQAIQDGQSSKPTPKTSNDDENQNNRFQGGDSWRHHDGDHDHDPRGRSGGEKSSTSDTNQNHAQDNNQNNSQSNNQNNTQAAYKDGTYTGSASNRIGYVEVAVTIKNKKIQSVKITNCQTRYPESNIDGLPAQVVQRQSADTDLVSGATLSSEDFQNAVRHALQQARS